MFVFHLVLSYKPFLSDNNSTHRGRETSHNNSANALELGVSEALTFITKQPLTGVELYHFVPAMRRALCSPAILLLYDVYCTVVALLLYGYRWRSGLRLWLLRQRWKM